MATLQSQYPQQFDEWAAAGGIESNFRLHLIALGVIQATEKDLFSVAQVALNQTQGILTQLQNRNG